MRLKHLGAVLLGLGLISCSRDNRAHRRDEPAARQVGREAYNASQEIKRGAKEAAQEVRKAGKEFREGWGEARREAPAKPKKNDRQDR